MAQLHTLLRAITCSLALAAVGNAQGPVPMPQAHLQPTQTAVLDRLQALESLPDGPWKFHDGDVAHGEAATLDDSGWQTVQAKSNAGKEAVWYRRVIEVPAALHGYNLTGADVSFRFRASANGPMPQIIYFDGRRVATGRRPGTGSAVP